MKPRLVVATVLVAVVLGLGMLEIGLRLLSLVTTTVAGYVPLYLPDAVLGIRPNPEAPSHDARGWRNPAAADRTEILVFGDSQTYGLNARSEESWPHRLGAALSASVYSMAFGTYGAPHYLAMLDEGLRLKPELVIAAYYFGNDIRDAYSYAYKASETPRTTADPRIDSLATTDPERAALLERAEAIDPHVVRASYLDCQGLRHVPDLALQRIENILDSPPLWPLHIRPAPGAPGPRTGIDRILNEYWLSYRKLANRVARWTVTAAPDYGPPICEDYRWGDYHQIFSPAYRLLALERSDPRVVEGERIELESLARLAREVARSGADFMVVLIPTKELVFRDQARRELARTKLLPRHWQLEQAARDRAIQYLAARDIAVADALPALKALVAAGVDPYPHGSADGHPTKVGYAAIADAVIGSMKEPTAACAVCERLAKRARP